MSTTSIRRSFPPATLLLALVTGACTRNSASEDAGGPAGGAITLWTDSTELFMEYPALIVGAPEKFAVHLTDLTDFAPLRSGRITLRFHPRDGGAPLVVVQEVPRAPGIYGPAPEFTRAGIYDLTILVASPQATDSISVPGLQVYATGAEAPREEEGGDAGIPFLKEQQWKTPGFATAFARRGRLAETFEASAEIIPAAGRFAEVSAPIAGLVDAGDVASSPAPGARVRQGQILAFLRPALAEGGSSYSEARARLREAEDEHARARRLFEAEAVPERRVREAEIRLQAAREALSGMSGGELTSDGRLAIRSPISGVISQRNIVPGSRVDAGASLFTVVDPSQVWVEARLPAAVAARVGATAGAAFQAEGDTRSYRSTRTVSIGSVIDSLSRTLPAIFAFANPTGALKIGATGVVQIRGARQAEGLLISTSAILDDDGRAIVYVQPDGERFQRRVVTLGGSDGNVTLVLSGLEPGERVVTGAAYQVRLASLSTAVPAHGHEH